MNFAVSGLAANELVFRRPRVDVQLRRGEISDAGSQGSCQLLRRNVRLEPGMHLCAALLRHRERPLVLHLALFIAQRPVPDLGTNGAFREG